MKDIDAIPFLDVILKYKKPLAILAFSIALVTAFYTKFFVKEKFESEAIIYVTKLPEPESILPPQEFGDDEDTEGMIQILQSKGLRDSIVKNFSLLDHYQIDTIGDKKWRDNLDKQFFSNVEVETTSNDAISIKVVDYTPLDASNLANNIVETAGNIRIALFKDFLKDPLKDRKTEYLSKVKEVDELQLQLAVLSKKMQETGGTSNEKLSHQRLKNEFDSEVARMNQLRSRLDAAQSHYNASFSSIYWVSRAEPKYKKVFPKVSVVTLLVTFAVTGLVIVLLAIKERVGETQEEK